MISVLYVDDEPDLLDLGKVFLQREKDFSVDTFQSAPQALDRISTHTYDAIVSDYLMPGMDGLTLLKKIRGSGNPVPFIMFTGRGREEVVVEAFTSGASFYLQKGGNPVVQFAELSHKIRQAVEKRRAEERVRQMQWEWEHIFNAVENPITVLAPDHRIIAANRATLEALGLAEAEVLQSKCYQLFHHQESPPPGCPLETMIATKQYQAMQMEVEAMGGRYLVSCTPELDESGNLVKVIHICTRISG
ncbi:MAG: response regulator [Methanolinea sp.]|jgi:DNA-binding response OmpR family regulator|nr:response regulator [Methanolinea sp.]